MLKIALGAKAFLSVLYPTIQSLTEFEYLHQAYRE
jgi:hypothetical protein